MKYKLASVLLSATALLTQDAALLGHAFPTGAGGCDGNGSIESAHIWRDDVVNGTLSEGNLQVTIAGVALQPGAEVDVTAANPTLVELSVANSGGTPFRGFLFRLASHDGRSTVGEIFPNPEGASHNSAKISELCTAMSVGGVTHTSRDDKTVASAILKTIPSDSEETMTLEVTSVKLNTAVPSVSEWYYSSYTIKVAPGKGSDGDYDAAGFRQCATELQAQAECHVAHSDECAACTTGTEDQRNGYGARFLTENRALATSCSNPIREGYVCNNCCEACSAENVAVSDCLSGCQTDCTEVPKCDRVLKDLTSCFDDNPSCNSCDFDPLDLETTDFCMEFNGLSCSQASCCAACAKEVFESVNCVIPNCGGFGEENCNVDGKPDSGATVTFATSIVPFLMPLLIVVSIN